MILGASSPFALWQSVPVKEEKEGDFMAAVVTPFPSRPHPRNTEAASALPADRKERYAADNP